MCTLLNTAISTSIGSSAADSQALFPRASKVIRAYFHRRWCPFLEVPDVVQQIGFQYPAIELLS
jgi:hypothetical protein